jgi:DNA-binding SARP family transcriptional activator
LPAGGWVSIGLAGSIAAVAALIRLHRRRRARLQFPIVVRTGSEPAPVPASLASVDAVGSRHIRPAVGGLRQVGPSLPVPVGVDVNGAEVSLFDLPGPGIALSGEGAEDAARAILAAALTTGAVDTAIESRPVVVTTTNLMVRLLPAGTTPVGLDPDRTSFDGERLIILADTAAAVTHAEEEMIVRRRLLDTFEVDTVIELNARTDHAETQPPYVLLIEATTRHAGRLHTVAAYRNAVDLHPVVVGATDGIPTLEVAGDGTVTGDDETPGGRLAVLAAGDLAAVLAMLTEVMTRPEAGHDVDDPPSQTAHPAPPTEPTEAIPAQRHTPALVQVRVLGAVTASTDAGPIATGMRTGSYAILALLAAHPTGRTLAQFADAIYPTDEETVAVKRIRTYINTVRRVLREATGHPKPMFIVHNTTTGLYHLDPDLITVDLWRMLTAIERAKTAADDNAALAALRDATDLYAGDFADGRDHPWAIDYAITYRRQILAAHTRISELLEADQPGQAIDALERAIDLDPVNEELYQRIMRIYGRAHRPDAVNRTLRRLEERLAELDAEPSAATRRVAERQLRPEPVPGGRL